MKAENNRFDEMFKLSFQSAPTHWRDSLIFVADTAYMCRLWLMDYAPGWTPSDLMKMTELVVAASKQERELEERENAKFN